MQRKCPYCGSSDLELVSTNYFLCKTCDKNWWLDSVKPQPQYNHKTGLDQQPYLVTKKSSIGKFLEVKDGQIIYQREQVDRETDNGLDTTITRSFAQSGSGHLIHDDSEVVGECKCGQIIHKNEYSRCQHHASRELLCGLCTYEFKGMVMCRRGFVIRIIYTVCLFPFKLAFHITKEILSLIFLSE